MSPDPSPDRLPVALEPEVVYGQLRIAGINVALPLTAVREAVPCPAEFAPLPTAVAGVRGAINLRRLVLPVMDLRATIGGNIDPGADQVVVVVAHEEQIVGVLAEEIRGVVRVPTSALLAMATTAGTLLFSHTFRHPVSGEVISVLDAERLVCSPGVPTVVDPEHTGTSVGPARAQVPGTQTGTAAQAPAVDPTTTPSRTLMLVRCGPQILAVDVAEVHTTVPSAPTRPSVLNSTLCRGVIDFQNLEVPVIDPLVLLGLGEMPPGTMGAGLVLNTGTGYLVLALSGLLDLTELPNDAVLPLARFALNRPELIAGVADVADVGQCLVMDGAALLAAPEVVALASVNTSLEAWTPSAGDVTRSRSAGESAVSAEFAAAEAAAAGPHLTFLAGVDAATPLEQVVEILPLPGHTTSTEVGGSVLGIMVHRGYAVPILSLARLLGREPQAVSLSSCVLVVSVDDDHVAFAIDALHSIRPLEWVDPERSPTGEVDMRRVLPSAPLVRVAGQDRLLPVLDLRAIARAVRSSVSAEPAALVGV